MKTITKKILVDRIADESGLPRNTVKAVLQDFLEHIVTELGEGNRIEFRDFGVFEVRRRAARTAQNPKTLERVPVSAKRSVRFKPGRRVREQMELTDTQTPVLVIELKPAPEPVEPDTAGVERDVVATIGVRTPESVGAR